jgi:hypothetical protein
MYLNILSCNKETPLFRKNRFFPDFEAEGFLVLKASS